MVTRRLSNSILTQIIILIGLFVFSIAGLRQGHSLLEKREAYLGELLLNEQNRLELSHILQNKLLSVETKLLDMASVSSYQEVDHHVSILGTLYADIQDVLSVIEAGGTVEEEYPVNLENRRTIKRLISYKKYSKDRINLQTLELRAKLAELHDVSMELITLVNKRIELVDLRDTYALAHLDGEIKRFYKAIEPFFNRILENSNRLHFEGQQEMQRIRNINYGSMEKYRMLENLAVVLSTLLILFAGSLVFRSSRRIILDRRTFQQELEDLNNNLEETVNKRTAELETEVKERKAAEQKSAEQAEFLTSTIEALAHPFYVIDAETYNIVLANSAAHDSATDPGQLTCHALTHQSDTPCDGSSHPCPLRIVKETGQPVVLEHIHKDNNGREIIVEVHGYPIFDENGRLSQMIEYSLDVTSRKKTEVELQKAHAHLEDKVIERTLELEEQIRQRKQAQMKLSRSERYFRQILENISDIITIVDEEGKIHYTSPSAKRMLGLDLETARGMNIRSFVVAEDVRNVEIEHLYDKHSGISPIEYRVRDTSGDVHIMESFVQRFQEEGTDNKFIFCTRDITGRKRAEDEARKLKMVVEQSPSSVVITDTKGTIEYVNPAFEEITGYTAEEAIGQNPRILKSGETPEAAFTQLWKTIASGRIWQGEFVNRKKDGTFYEENVLVVPIKGHSGEIMNFVAVKENITELRKARKQAENANRAKSKFLSNMSHELRTPLNAINGFSQLMLKSKKNPLNDKQRNMAEQIAAAGDHLLQLINEVLDLARIEAGELALSLEVVETKTVIQESLSMIQPLADKKDITVTDTSEDLLPAVRADFTRLRQILLNLMSNAVKYNNLGGSVSITVETNLPGILRFVVVDTGIGISEEKQKDIFTPFARMIDSPNDVEGTGIGMTITRQIVEQMGGDIGFESQLGVGSTFWFTLPVAVLGASLPISKGEESPQAPVVLERDSSHIRKVLYIEDNLVNIAFMKNVFENWDGYQLQVCETGEKGLEKAVSMRPDLILLDLSLPEMDGFQVFRALRGQPETEFIPVIAVSADAMEETVKRVHKQGFNGYLSKPVDIDLLHSTIQETLEVA